MSPTGTFVIVPDSLEEDPLVGRNGGTGECEGSPTSLSSEDCFKSVGTPIFIEHLRCAPTVLMCFTSLP